MGNPATPRKAEGSYPFLVDHLRKDLQNLSGAPNALRLVQALVNVRHLIPGGPDEKVEAAIENALIFLPDLLGIFADGLETQILNAREWMEELDGHLRPRFELAPSNKPQDLPQKFFRRSGTELNQEALMDAWRAGELPSCIRIIEPEPIYGGER